VCERTLLTGEEPLRFAPDGSDEFVDVCVLCQEVALDHGWIREGSPMMPAMRPARRRPRLSLGGIFGAPQRRPPVEAVTADLPARRLSDEEHTVAEAAALFNASDYLRTVEGIARSLGEPRVGLVALQGPNREVVVTFVWDISWYQYRVSPETQQPVRLAERGLEPDELEEPFRLRNARLEPHGIVLELDAAPA
jgi:hypothetical protein